LNKKYDINQKIVRIPISLAKQKNSRGFWTKVQAPTKKSRLIDQMDFSLVLKIN
jgi:hypothetical protein